jgi:uncharacterized YccA/Bax inhibitor family protein
MQSSNPVFARSEGFNGRDGTAYADFGQAPPSTHSPVGVGTGRMTIDTVVQKTAFTLGVVVLAAAATWILTGDIVNQDTGLVDDGVASQLYTLSIIGAFGGFILSLVNSFKRVISPGLVIAYAAFQGVAVGAFSKVIGQWVGDGVVVGAVLGTVAAVAGILAAYKFFNIQVGNKFRKWTVGMMFGFVAVSLLDFVLGMFHADFGFNGFGAMGFIASVVGLGIGVMMLIMDFDFVERGIAAGLPERESWRAAFALTVTIVWIYIELLRLLAILRGD